MRYLCIADQNDAGDQLCQQRCQGCTAYAKFRERSDSEDQQIIQRHIAQCCQDRNAQCNARLSCGTEHIGYDE